MLGEQNNIVKQQLVRQLKQLSSKQSMIQFYMSYDYPQKQRGIKNWWEELIENVIKKKNQIFVTFKDLETITTIHNMKPVPLKNVLKQLKKQFVFVKEEDITLQKKIERRVKPSWYENIISFAWANNSKEEVENPFKFQGQQRIISTKTKQKKKRELINYLQKQFTSDNSRFLRDFIKQLSWALKIDQASVSLILQQLKKDREIVLGQADNFGDNVLIYNHDKRKMVDTNFIKTQKIKCLLRGNLYRFEQLYDKSSNKISNLKQKAKQSLVNNDKNKARVILTQVKKQEQYRSNISLRKQVLDQKIILIQLNQMNKSSIDLLQQAQKVYQQIAVDSQKLEQVIQKSRQIQMQSQQANRNFQQLAGSQQINNQVDDLMKELEMQNANRKRVVEPQAVRVAIQKKEQKRQVQGVEELYNIN